MCCGLLMLALAMPGGAWADRAADLDGCAQRDDRALRITACSALLAADDPTGLNLARVYLARGEAYLAGAEYSRAVADFTEALAREDDLYVAHNGRGYALQRLGKYDLAVVDFTRALSLVPDAVEALSNRGNARCLMGDIEGALADWAQAVAVAPDFARLEQDWLARRGFYLGPIDGQFGPSSRDAQRRYAEAGCPGLD